MDNEVERIAAGLTKAQRLAIGYSMRGYFDPNTVKSLRRKGLLEGVALNDRGLAVRAYLEKNQ